MQIENNNFPTVFGLDKISLIPRVVSSIVSRENVSLETKLGKISLSVPIIASPMKDVCDGGVASKMRSIGGLGIINRFMNIEDQIKEHNKSKDSYCAIGINGDFKERFQSLFLNGCRLFCIDVANGANLQVKKAIEQLESDDVQFIVGNVASKECYQFLDNIDRVVGIRVGIAGGSACTTKNATGVFTGMASAILECSSFKRKTALIADGGIKEPGDMCKAIACGADFIMLGSIIANTKESPAEVILQNNENFKIYNGSASFEIQCNYKEKPKYIEGKTKLLKYSGESIDDVVSKFSDGLRSSLSYFNSNNIEEYKRNVSINFLIT